jgi:hypothetical protein
MCFPEKTRGNKALRIYQGYGTQFHALARQEQRQDNGFGAPITNSNYGTQYNYTSQGKHLVQVKTNGQTEVKIPYILMHGAATISGTTGNTSGSSASAGAYLSYNAAPDDRGVRLIRDCAPSPKQKGAPDVVIDEARDEWVDVDGTGYGHTRWSYKERQAAPPSGYCTTLYADSPVGLMATINASRFGDWSNNLTFSWTPGHALDNILEHFQELPNGSAVKDPIGIVNSFVAGNGCPTYIPQPPGWYNIPSSSASNNGSVTVKYKLTDNDYNVTAIAKYVLTLHDEWEQFRPDPWWGTDRQERLIPAFPRRDDWDGHLTNPTTLTWNVSHATGLELSAGFSPGFNIGTALSFGVNIQGSYSHTVTEDLGIEITAAPNKMMYRRVRQSWLRRHYIADHYTVCGWDNNTARSDGAWEQWWDDLSTVSNDKEFSLEYELGDYNMDGVVDYLDDAVV